MKRTILYIYESVSRVLGLYLHIIQYLYKSKGFLVSVFVLFSHVSDAWNAVMTYTHRIIIDLMNWRHEAISKRHLAAQMLIKFGLYILFIGNA